MTKFILGRKLNMTRKFTEDGNVVGVTAVEAGPCTIVQVKGEKDGYTAIQLGYGQKNKLTKALAGHLKGLSKFRYLQEFRVESTDGFEKGKVIDLSSFAAGDVVAVTAVSKGKGFQGVVKRHGFHGSPASHGHKDQLRMPGSIGATDAARVFKGTRMGGRMGGDTVTTKNLKVIEVDLENNIIYIAGSVPGARNSVVRLVAEGEIKLVEPKKAEPKKEAKEVKEEKVEEKPAEDKKPEVKEEAKKEEKPAPKKEEVKKEEKPKQEPKAEEKKEEVKEEKK